MRSRWSLSNVPGARLRSRWRGSTSCGARPAGSRSRSIRRRSRSRRSPSPPDPSYDRPVDEADLRAAMVAAGARLGARGLITAGEGNLSVRVAGDRLLVTPSGWRKDELTPDDVLFVP